MAARTYRLTVAGELGDRMASAFPGMTLTPGEGTTTLSGELDQTELQDVFGRIADLGLTLLETKSVKSANGSNRDPVKAVNTGEHPPP